MFEGIVCEDINDGVMLTHIELRGVVTELGCFLMYVGFGNVNLSTIVNTNQIYFQFFQADIEYITKYTFQRYCVFIMVDGGFRFCILFPFNYATDILSFSFFK